MSADPRRTYPTHPRLGVGVVLVHEGCLLLVQRAQEPLRGYWTLPGGVVELGESLRAAAAREVREETGLEVEVGALVELFERVDRDPDGPTGTPGPVRFHYVIADFRAELKPGASPQVRAASDAQQAAWVPWAQLAALPLTPGLLEVLAKAALPGWP